MFHIGQMVLCVNDDPTAFRRPGKITVGFGLDGLTKGMVYTVRGTNGCDCWRCKDNILIEEIVRDTDFCGTECGFKLRPFPPRPQDRHFPIPGPPSASQSREGEGIKR